MTFAQTPKRITIFAGHYGSGKTTLAANYALALKNNGFDTVVCDLDVVNPYFRTADYADLFALNGIRLISSELANTNVEAPSAPEGVKMIFDNKNIYGVIDLGGDARGALALGRYAGALADAGDYGMLMVINRCRPLTREPSALSALKDEIESAAGILFTGIINNTNLAAGTTAEDIKNSAGFAAEVADILGLPLTLTAVKAELADQFTEENIFPVTVLSKKIWAV